MDVQLLRPRNNESRDARLKDGEKPARGGPRTILRPTIYGLSQMSCGKSGCLSRGYEQRPRSVLTGCLTDYG